MYKNELYDKKSIKTRLTKLLKKFIIGQNIAKCLMKTRRKNYV